MNIFNNEEAIYRRELAEVLDATKDTEGAIKLLIGITYDPDPAEDPEQKDSDEVKKQKSDKFA